MADETVPRTDRTTIPLGRGGLAMLRAALSERGQALVEFAIVVPLILLIVLGIADFGLAYNYKNDLTSLANQAVRYAEVNDCAPCGVQSIEDYVWSNADSGELRDGNSGGLGIEKEADNRGLRIKLCLPLGQPAKDGDPITAVAWARYIWLPFLGIDPSVVIESSATGRIEPGAVAKAGGPVNFASLPTCPPVMP